MAMEQYYFHPITLLVLEFTSLLIFSLSLLFYKHRSQFTGENLPPGNVGYPIIGETYRFVSSAQNGHPEKFISDRVNMHNSKVFKTSFIGERVAFFCGAACNKFLFSNESKLVRAWHPSCISMIFPSIETSSFEESIKMRRILLNFLKPEALQRYLGIIDQLTKSHFEENWENHDQVYPLNSPRNQADIERLRKPFSLVNAGTMSLPINLPGTPLNKAIKAAELIRKDLYKIIQQRKSDLAAGKISSSVDMLTHMLLATEEDGSYMKESRITDNILGTLVAGFDTVSAELSFIVKYLAELPHIYDAVYKEQMEIVNSKPAGEPLKWEDLQKMKYSWNVAQEVMRLKSPIQGAFREASTNFSYNGFTIPKGWKLYWSASWTHKNADYFPEPEKFDPSRFEGTGPEPYSFVPFGGGPKMCPGYQYAKVVILVFMHHLVTRFKWEKLIPNEKTIVVALPYPAEGLPIRLYHHKKM